MQNLRLLQAAGLRRPTDPQGDARRVDPDVMLGYGRFRNASNCFHVVKRRPRLQPRVFELCELQLFDRFAETPLPLSVNFVTDFQGPAIITRTPVWAISGFG